MPSPFHVSHCLGVSVCVWERIKWIPVNITHLNHPEDIPNISPVFSIFLSFYLLCIIPVCVCFLGWFVQYFLFCLSLLWNIIFFGFVKYWKSKNNALHTKNLKNICVQLGPECKVANNKKYYFTNSIRFSSSLTDCL